MSPVRKLETLPEIYNHALVYARDKHIPVAQRPSPTSVWPEGHLETLERYRTWLLSGGASPHTVRLLYLIVGGHVLGFNLKPLDEIDLESDLEKVMAYILAKNSSKEWTKLNKNALIKFRKFLMHERGLVEINTTSYDPLAHTEELPEWLVASLQDYQTIKQINWRTARIEESIRRFWVTHLCVWRFLVSAYQIDDVSTVNRRMLYAFVNERLNQGSSSKGVNAYLRAFHSFLRFLEDQGIDVPLSVLRFPSLKEPEPLPKFLTDEQAKMLKNAFEKQVLEAKKSHKRRDALLNRATFYLLWQSALRISEVEDLQLEDVDLQKRVLYIRKSKNMLDRTVFMTHSSVNALATYLAVRGMGPTEHVFLYRNQPLKKDLVRGRLKAIGKELGIHVYPHRLRHTCATQLINAGCSITSIQKFLGHKKLKSTMIYVKVHEKTVSNDYYAAMLKIE